MKKNVSDQLFLKNRKGYMLIEALIALAIFSIGFLAVATLVFSATRNNANGNVITQANMLAREKMEQLKSTIDLATLVGGEDPGLIDGQGNGGGIYKRRWSISEPVGFGTSRQIQVTVSWNWRGQNRRVVFATITKGRGI